MVAEILEPWSHSKQHFWIGIYEALLWYEHGLPHIIDSNDLRKSAWRERAQRVERALMEAISCTTDEVARKVDRLLQHPALAGQQRQNPLGKGFSACLVYLLRKHCPTDYEFLPEAIVGQDVFRGIGTPPRQRVDIAVKKKGREYAIISTKWSIRHDRLKDWLDECDFYKTQARLPYYFVATNEYGPARLKKVLENRCQNGVYHVRKALLLETCSDPNKVNGIEDLISLFDQFA